MDTFCSGQLESSETVTQVGLYLSFNESRVVSPLEVGGQHSPSPQLWVIGGRKNTKESPSNILT